MPLKNSRRDFLKRFSVKKSSPKFSPVTKAVETTGGEDPLFKKYSRKKPGRKRNETNGTALRVGTVTSGLALYTGSFTDWEKKHLVNRLTAGFRTSDLNLLNALSVSQAVDLLVPTQANIPALAPPINNYQNSQADAAGVAYGQSWANSALQWSVTNHPETGYARIYSSLKNWQAGTYIKSNTSITEKMTLFWYHFIPVGLFQLEQQSDAGINAGRIMYNYISLLRNNCLGNFKTMIRKICTDPAMMNYLSNQNNTATEPNENFARELLELFTLGKGPESQYTESDVAEAAKVLTGWYTENLEQLTTVTNFIPDRHSQDNKTFSPFFNNTVINNRPGTQGALELDDLINMIFSKQDVVAKYICRRLYRFFVYYDIDANIETNVIAPLAQTFINNNWEIRPVLQQLFKSQHFFDAVNRGVIIKSPLDLYVGFYRVFNMNISPTDSANYEALYNAYGTASYYCEITEQHLMNPPTVSGWRPYYQEPAFHQAWITSDSVQRRYSYLEGLLWGYFYEIEWRVEHIAWARQSSAPGNPNTLVADTIKFLLPVDLSLDKRNQIKTQTLLSGQQSDNYWTSLWNQYNANPADQGLQDQVINRLRNLYFTIVRLAEFQLA
jgi:uncharacterized protein (DUF1800 family)